MVPEHRHAVLDPAGAVRNLGEVVLARGLLRRAEGAVIGRRGLQVARLQPAPERLLVLLGAEGRAHHVGPRGLRIGLVVNRIVDHQVLHQAFAVCSLALQPGAGHGLQRLLARDVDNVDRRVQHLRDADRAVRRLALHLGRARLRMPLGPGDALLQQLLLQVPDQLAVLGMDRAERAQLLAAREARQQLLVVQHDRALVGHEVLEAVDPVLAREHAHVLLDPLVPVGDGDVEGIIRRRLGGALHPVAPGLHRPALGIGDHEVDDHRGAAGERRRRAGEEIVGGHRAHEGQFHVGVRIDPARHHQRAASIDDLGARRRLQPLTHGLDRAVFAVDVRPLGFVGGDHRATPDHQRHRCLPGRGRARPRRRPAPKTSKSRRVIRTDRGSARRWARYAARSSLRR